MKECSIKSGIRKDPYKRIFPVFWEHPAVRGVTLWGYRPGLWRNETKAYLIEEDGVTERPALVWLRSYVEESTITTSTQPKSSDQIKLDPNSVTSGTINIQGIDNLTRVELYDLSGRLM